MQTDSNSQRCPVCESENISLLIQQPSSHHLPIQRIFDVIQCASCRFAFVANPPTVEEIKACFDSNFFSSSQQTIVLDNGKFGKKARASPMYRNALGRLTGILKHVSSGRLIDVGCGKGVFLKKASEHFLVTGTDISESAVAYGRDVLGLDMVLGDFLNLDIKSSPFDVVTMWDVLASFAEPTKCFAKLTELATPDGLIVFTVPDIDSFCFKVTRRYWPMLIPPINLSYFSRQSVEVMLRSNGAELVSYKPKGKYVSTNFALRKLGRITGIMALDRPDIALPFVNSLYLNFGDIATVYARKQNA